MNKNEPFATDPSSWSADIEPAKTPESVVRLNAITNVLTDYNLQFTATNSDEYFLMGTSHGRTYLPAGFILKVAVPEGASGCIVNDEKIMRALDNAAAAVGINDADIKRTTKGIWINQSSLDRIVEAIENDGRADVNEAPNGYKYFADAFKGALTEKTGRKIY